MDITWLSNLTNIKLDPGLALILAAFGSIAMVMARQLPMIIYTRIKMMLTVLVVIDENDNMAGSFHFESFNRWVGENRLEALTRIFEMDRRGKRVAGTGFNVIRWKGRYFWCTMMREKPNGTFHKTAKVGNYTLYTWKWNQSLLDELLDEGTSPPDMVFEGMIYDLRELENGSRFPPYTVKQPQLIGDETLALLKGVFEKFLKGNAEYYDKCMPHKEVALLYGPPGTGKTSVIRYLCALFNCDLIKVLPDEITANTFKRRSYNSRAANGPTVYLIEDIDSNKDYHRKDSLTGNSKSNIVVNTGDSISAGCDVGSISALLNALDGVTPLDDCIVIITTNHLEKLEESIYRVGRVDHLINVNYMELDGAIKAIGWAPEDERCKYLLTDQRANAMPAGTINMLKYCKTIPDLDKVLSGKELSLSVAA